MLVTKDFSFIHVPKTGGTFVRKVLTAHFDCVEEGQPHVGQPPDYVLQKPVLTFVRNPWDWYVSWFHYTLNGEPDNRGPDSPWAVLCDHGRADFGSSVRRAVLGVEDGPEWTAHLRNGGLYHLWWFRTTNRANKAGVLDARRFENLRGDLLAFLHGHAEVSTALDQAIRSEAPEMVSVRTHYRDYYDDETRTLVAQCPLVERFGYEF